MNNDVKHNASNVPVLVFDGVSKKYCRSLKRSLWYGIKDIAAEFLLHRRKAKSNIKLRAEEFWGLHDVSFTLNRGESLAIVGSNGAGKSTALKLLYGLIKPDAGSIHTFGSIGAIIELGAGFDPTLSGRENIYIRTALFGLSRKETNELIEEIIDFAEINDFIDSPVKHYSSGMLARLSFAVSAHLNPTVLLVDEVLAVGDLSFQRKCINQMLNYLDNGGSLILVSHSPSLIQSTCKRGILLDKGRIVFEGSAVETVDKYFDSGFLEEGLNKSTAKKIELTEKNPIAIDNIFLESLEREEIYTGDDVKLTVDYSSYKSFKNVGWMFTIWSPDNMFCITGDATIESISIKEGGGQLSCRISKIPLLASKYILKMTIVELPSLHPLITFGELESGYLFDVKTTPSLIVNAMLTVRQSVTIETIWN